MSYGFFHNIINRACHVASALQYTEAKKIVHRDLALRNILATTSNKEGEKYQVKVADFGLSRNLDDSKAYYKAKQGAMPIRWTAPEALTHGVFTSMHIIEI